MADQYEFAFAFPRKHYPAACLHVSKDGIDGYVVDEEVRVCGHECGALWAKMHGRWLTGENCRYTKDGLVERSFATKRPEDVVRASLAHLFNLIRR